MGFFFHSNVKSKGRCFLAMGEIELALLKMFKKKTHVNRRTVCAHVNAL